MKDNPKTEARKYKKLFDLCNEMGEGVHGKIHICNASEDDRFPDEDQSYRIYHANGFCFDIRREKVYLEEDETNESAIGEFEYSFMEGIYDGFKEIDINSAIALIHPTWVKATKK